jgi:hypothetical protein
MWISRNRAARAPRGRRRGVLEIEAVRAMAAVDVLSVPGLCGDGEGERGRRAGWVKKTANPANSISIELT